MPATQRSRPARPSRPPGRARWPKPEDVPRTKWQKARVPPPPPAPKRKPARRTQPTYHLNVPRPPPPPRPRENVYSIHNMSRVPRAVCDGRNLHFLDRSLTTITTDGLYRKIMIITHSTDTNAHALTVDVAPAPILARINGRMLTAGPTAGGPTSASPIRNGVEVHNTTNSLNVGGRVFAGILDQRIELPTAPTSMSQGQWTTFYDDVSNMPEMKPLSPDQLRAGFTLSNVPVDYTRYDSFLAWRGTGGSWDEFGATWGLWPGFTPQPRAMTTIVLLWDVFSAANTYSVGVNTSYRTRWPADLGYSRLMSHDAVASQQALSRANIAAPRGPTPIAVPRTSVPEPYQVPLPSGGIW